VARYLWMAALCWVALAGTVRAADGKADPATTPPAGGAAAAQPAPAASGTAQTPDEKADLKVRALEDRVSDLKEKIFRTKARLMSLQEMVIGGDISSGAKLVIVHKNEMGASFYLESVAYALDGAPVFTKVDVDGDLEKRSELEIFNGRVSPSEHQISVQLVYKGHGYGLFSYLEGYRFTVKSSSAFKSEAGKVTTVRAVGFEKGGITAELKDRPAVRFDVDVQREDVVQPASSKDFKAGAGASAKEGAAK
jgi:hypothetical protein